MADTMKCLLQVLAVATPGDADWSSVTSIYTVPDRLSAVISSIVICENAEETPDVTIALFMDSSDMAALSTKNLLFNDVGLTSQQTKIISAGIALDERNVLAITSDGTVGVNVFGVETK